MSDTQIKERIEHLAKALAGEGFGYHEDTRGAYLIDDEGERACRLSEFFVDIVAAVPPEQAAEILKHVYLARTCKNEESFRAGKRAGRAEIIGTVHELLGIDRIAKSLDSVENMLGEIRGS